MANLSIKGEPFEQPNLSLTDDD